MKNIKRKALVIASFILIFTIFLTAAYMAYEKEVAEQKEALQNNITELTSNINRFLNQSLRNAKGVIAYMKTNPDMTQEEFADYVAEVMPEDENIISHYTGIRDTTIAFVYPYEGNESAIGINLGLIEGQNADLLYVKEHFATVLSGPVELVQGGQALIYRTPVIQDNNTYWGQLSVVFFHEELLENTGITAFSKNHNLSIDFFDYNTDRANQIYLSDTYPSKEAVTFSIDAPTGLLEIRAESKDGISGLNLLVIIIIILGLIFSLLISGSIQFMLSDNDRLNKLVDERTRAIEATNETLKHTILELKTAQNQLIDKEQFANLGEMVSRTAHEINTPLGACVTVTSYIENANKKVRRALESNQLKRSQLTESIKNIEESTHVLSTNLDRAVQLVQNFRKLSLDQTLDEIQKINLNEYVDYVLKVMSPTIKKYQPVILNKVDDSINLETYPGALFQVITNLITNSLYHGFEGLENGEITILSKYSERIFIDYFDNGHGIPEDQRDHVFEPFFTTKKDQGGTGLGLPIIADLVVNKLQGEIALLPSDQGVHFRIIMPKSIKAID